MPMDGGYGYNLEQSRGEKVRSLGFLCYNLCVDGVMAFPEMKGLVDEIKKTLDYLLAIRENGGSPDYIRMHESCLNEKLTELGCVCYNLYIDNKLFNSSVLALCDTISSINREISSDSASFGANDSADAEHSYSDLEIRGADRKTVNLRKLKVSCPYGMEMIPVDFKRCQCGYRNRSYAVFCAKCGAAL